MSEIIYSAVKSQSSNGRSLRILMWKQLRKDKDWAFQINRELLIFYVHCTNMVILSFTAKQHSLVKNWYLRINYNTGKRL